MMHSHVTSAAECNKVAQLRNLWLLEEALHAIQRLEFRPETKAGVARAKLIQGLLKLGEKLAEGDPETVLFPELPVGELAFPQSLPRNFSVPTERTVSVPVVSSPRRSIWM